MFLLRIPLLLAIAAIAIAQQPVITSVRNAASLGASGRTVIAPQMIISIFGANLANSTESASGFPLPTTLAGTFVHIGGLGVPLLYVSPTQINAQVPTGLIPPGTLPNSASITLSTPTGSTGPLAVDVDDQALGIFTQAGSGCGQGAIFNIHADGSLALNTPQDSLDPQHDFGLAIFFTGLGGAFDRHDGLPWIFNPNDNLASPSVQTLGAFIGIPGINQTALPLNLMAKAAYIGPAPGLVGVDQVNAPLFRDPAGVSHGVPEGCHLPLVLTDFFNSTSQIVNVSIHSGGGACSTSAVSSLASVEWRKTFISDANGFSSSDSVAVQFLRDDDLAFPQPSKTEFAFVDCCHVAAPLAPKACPSSLPATFDAGVIVASGPGFDPLTIAPRAQSGQVIYEAALPPGAIQGGDYHVTSNGAFDAVAHIPAPIAVTTNLTPGAKLKLPINVTWTGGDADSIVRVQLLIHAAPQLPIALFGSVFDQRVSAPASQGSIQIGFPQLVLPFGPPSPVPSGDVEIIVTQEPSASPAQPFSAPNLTMGGEQRWRYTFDYRGLKN